MLHPIADVDEKNGWAFRNAAALRTARVSALLMSAQKERDMFCENTGLKGGDVKKMKADVGTAAVPKLGTKQFAGRYAISQATIFPPYGL